MIGVHPLFIVMVIASLFGGIFLVVTLRALRKIRLLSGIRNACIALCCFFITTVSGMLVIANHGYRSLLHEECAATVAIEPAGTQRFIAHVTFPDGVMTVFGIKGDQLYIDAHILKWHPWLNLFGVHTTYELDRIGGRYITIDDEKTKPRSVFTLSKTKGFNMFNLRRRWRVLRPLVEAEYGSATFIYADQPVVFKVMVSVTGLLIRNAGKEI